MMLAGHLDGCPWPMEACTGTCVDPAAVDWPLVEVRWEDATNSGEWTTLEKAQRFDHHEFDYRCRSVGYLVRDDDECVVLASRRTGTARRSAWWSGYRGAWCSA